MPAYPRPRQPRQNAPSSARDYLHPIAQMPPGQRQPSVNAAPPGRPTFNPAPVSAGAALLPPMPAPVTQPPMTPTPSPPPTQLPSPAPVPGPSPGPAGPVPPSSHPHGGPPYPVFLGGPLIYPDGTFYAADPIGPVPGTRPPPGPATPGPASMPSGPPSPGPVLSSGTPLTGDPWTDLQAVRATPVPLDEVGKQRYGHALAEAKARYGPVPFAGISGLPSPPIEPGKPNFNPWLNLWS